MASGRALLVDVGRTFTDLVLVDEVSGAVRVAKGPTTVRNQAAGGLAALARAATTADQKIVVQGTITATNALLERKGPSTGRISTYIQMIKVIWSEHFKEEMNVARLLGRAGLFLMAVLLCVCSVPSAVFAQPVGVYVQYQIWYSRGGCPTDRPQSTWSHWSWWSADDDPCTVTAARPWMRTISASAYPLIGPYSSDNPHVFRWHIRLAKAAGIDGFLVAVFPGTEPTFFKRFERMLRVAYEEDFQIGFEGWTPDKLRVGEWQSATVRYIDHFANHSPFRKALLRINGKPVFWFNLSGRTQGIDEVAAFFDSVEAFWIFSGGMSLDEEQELKARLTRSIATRDTQYNYPTEHGFAFIGDFGRQVQEKLDRALHAFSHGFPGFDEQMASDTEGRSGRFGLRKGGQTLRDYLRSARDARVHGVIVSSWNEWIEMSSLEPGFDALFRAAQPREEGYGNDPYAMLRIIAEFKGIPWKAPEIPCRIVDRLLIQYKILRCRPF